MVDQYNLSFGSKTIGRIGLAVVMLTGLVFIVLLPDLYTIIMLSAVLLFFAIQLRYQFYIDICISEFIISNVFLKTIRKSFEQFESVDDVFLFTHLRIIRFKDGTSFMFIGRSIKEIEELIARMGNG